MRSRPTPVSIPTLLNFLKFCAIGGSVAAINVGLLYLSVEVLRLPYLPAFACIFVTTTICAYLASRTFAFSGTTVGLRSGLLRYLGVTTASLLINSVLLVILVEVFDLHPVLSSGLIAVANAPVNFLLHRRLTFRVLDGGRRGTT